MADDEKNANGDIASAVRPSGGQMATGPIREDAIDVDHSEAGESGGKSEAHEPGTGTVGAIPAASAKDPVTIGPAVTGSAGSAGTEWTASDARGPLDAAPADTTAAAATGPAREEPVRDTSAPSAASSSTMPSSTTPRRSVAGPVFAGLVIGAFVGAGSAALVYRLAPTAGDEASVAALSARVDALGRRPDPQPAIADLKGSVAALDGGLATLRTSVAASQKADGPQGSSAPRAAPPPANGSAATPAFDPTPLQQKVATLQGDVDALRKDGAAAKGDARDFQGKLAGVAAALAASQKQASVAQDGVRDVQEQQKTLQSAQQGLQGQQKALEGKLNAPALAVVADSLVQQIARGLPYATQVDALAAIGADPARVAVLRQGADKGVPTAKALGDAFDPLADVVIEAGRKTAPGAGFVARMEAGLFSLVSIRRTDDTNGTSAASRVSRIQADLAHDDVSDAYATWQALPDDAKAKSQAWGALAKTQVEAMTAARLLQHDAIAALGAKKS